MDKTLDFFDKTLPKTEERLFRSNVILLLVMTALTASNDPNSSDIFFMSSKFLVLAAVLMVIVSQIAFDSLKSKKRR